MVGSRVGDYRIVEKIGEGGMGVVYKAVDENLGRVVAIKALSPEFSGNPALMERFRGEARAQAQLNHPNLATLYAFLSLDGAAFMIMEFIDGETFHHIVRERGPIPSAEAIPLFRQALAGLACAHHQGIVHRDIKPGNLMLNRDGVVKLMDFGLAKSAGGHGVTRSGVRLGTAYYMSPEQILMQPVDSRSDIYSLGATLYEMLTGQAPFHADSEFEILNGHVNTPPPPPSRLLPHIPAGLEHAVLKALAKDPNRRFQTAEEFTAALDCPPEFYMAATAADAAPTSPVPISPAKPPLWTRTRILLSAAAAGVACLIAAWLLIFQPRPIPVPIPHLVAALPGPPPVVAPVQPAPKPTPDKLPPDTSAPEDAAIVIPAATLISVRTVEPVDAKSAQPGQEFSAKLDADVAVNGREVFQADDHVQLRLGSAASAGNSGKPESILQLVSIANHGRTYAVISAPYVIKTSLLRKKKVSPGTRIDFTLSAPLTVPAVHGHLRPLPPTETLPFIRG